MVQKRIARFKLKKRSPFVILNRDYRQKGFFFQLYWLVISLSRSNIFFRYTIDLLAFLFYKLFRGNRTFIFNGERYKYFYHLYNRTIASERVVEVPIAWGLVNKYKSKQILEVGNVLSHYFKVNYDILDKYEKGEGVINEDVISYSPVKKYDLIISVSTMEHVGFSYGESFEPEKFSKGLENLKSLLRKGGLLTVTFSLFYNDYINQLIAKRRAPFHREYFMRRKSFWNEWEQVSRTGALKGSSYDTYYANSNVLYIGVFKKR